MDTYQPFPRRTRRPRRRPWTSLLFILSILLGLAVGLYYAWIINPVVYVEASPARLSGRYQTEYVYLIGRSYAAQPNLDLAQRRLAALDRPNVDQVVLEALETAIREGRPLDDTRAVAALARALNIEAPAIALFAPPLEMTTPEFDPEQLPAAVPTGLPLITPTTSTAEATSTPRMTSPETTATAAPTSELPRFQLISRERLCPPEVEGGRIELLVVDANGTPQAGIEAIITWASGNDRFITGFKEGGYGDFTMQPDTTYTLTLPDNRTRATSLRLDPCSDDQPAGESAGESATWRLTYLHEG